MLEYCDKGSLYEALEQSSFMQGEERITNAAMSDLVVLVGSFICGGWPATILLCESRPGTSLPSVPLLLPCDSYLTCQMGEGLTSHPLHPAMTSSRATCCPPGGCLCVTAIVETALDVAKAMVHMHAAGVLHSDLKARNIMLKTTGMEGKGFVGKVRDRCGVGLISVLFYRCVLNEDYCPWCTICFVLLVRVWAKHSQSAPPRSCSLH